MNVPEVRRLSGGNQQKVTIAVLASLLTVVDAPGAVRQILYGAIILAVAAAYARATADV